MCAVPKQLTSRLFADGSSLISSHLNLDYIENEIDMGLSCIDQWAKLWLVTFNPSKTDVMLFTNHLHYDYPSLLFGESILSFTNTHKHLGVTLQSSGKWDVHIDEMISKTMKMIGVYVK